MTRDSVSAVVVGILVVSHQFWSCRRLKAIVVELKRKKADMPSGTRIIRLLEENEERVSFV